MATFFQVDSDHLVTLRIVKDSESLEFSRSFGDFTLDMIVEDTIKLIDRFFGIDFYSQNSFNTYLQPYYLEPVVLSKKWYYEAEVLENNSQSVKVEFRNQNFIFSIIDTLKNY